MKVSSFYFIIAIFIFLGCNGAKNTTQKGKEPILMRIGNKIAVSVPEFKYMYEKSILNNDSLYKEKNLRDYLVPFKNYKLKVADALNKGLDTTDAFKKEFATYQEQLAQPFLIDINYLDTLVQLTYKRMSDEINVSHIMVKLSPDATPNDTLNAFKKIGEALAQTATGQNFENIALKYSEDYTVEQNKGNLGYITALQTEKIFEDVAYNTQKGQVSGIFRTSRGYHILKVNDKRQASGSFKIAHIMKHISKKANEEEKKKAKQKIDEIYERLQKGEVWDSLCKYSDDATSRNQKGILPEFTVGKIVPEMENETMKLKNPNDFSAPFQTAFGWHIIQLIQKKPIPTFREMQTYLKQQVPKETRFDYLQQLLIEKRKKEYKFTENQKLWSQIITKADNRLLQGSWSYNSTEPLNKEILLTMKSKWLKKEKKYVVKDFFDFVYEKQVMQPTLKDEKHYFYLLYERFKKFAILEFEKQNLEETRPEYKYLVNEYKEGTMIYELMNENVWKKALEDTAGVKKFFQEKRENYRWGQRANAIIYQLANENAWNELKPYLNKNLYPMVQIQMPTLLYDKNDISLNEDIMKALDEIIRLMKQDPNLKLEIIGHGDNTERKTIAQERIDPIIKQLTFKRIDAKRISSKNFGSTQPISKTDKKKNMRVELNLYSTSKKQLENILNQNTPNALKITEGLFQKKDNSYLDKTDWKTGNYTIKGENGKIFFIEILDIKEPRLKDFDEARGHVITDYQTFLEAEWLKELKNKYIIELNENELKKMIK
jgi:peptidyl-prolyl cis-trans isomerase SurA